MKKILTLVVDGLGLSDTEKGNAVKNAHTPTLDKLFKEYPSCTLEASGPALGLNEGAPGNNIVGYETLTFGKKLKQRSLYAKEFMDIDNLSTNSEIKNMVEHIRKNKSVLHIMGIMSDGEINSNIEDTLNLIEFLKNQNIKYVVDFICDGRDVETKSALKYIKMISDTGTIISTICGRYYALDDQGKFDRTKIYYDLVKKGTGLKVKEIDIALKNCYIRNITDEFIPPILLNEGYAIKENDGILWMNYESEPSKQILQALTNPKTTDYIQEEKTKNLKTLLLYPVDPTIDGIVLINEDENLTDNLGTYFSDLDLSQARIADQEYSDYVTYYFNGKSNKKLPKCTNYIINFPKDTEELDKVKTIAITKQIIRCMEKDVDFILASLSSVDELAHTGNYEKTKDMVEFVDNCIKDIVESAEMNFYKIILLSTHGNAEQMLDNHDNHVTINTCNKVPFVITDNNLKLSSGSLVNIAPTILSYMDIGIPDSMKESGNLIK